MIKIYTAPSCISCRKVKKYFKEHNIPYIEKNIGDKKIFQLTDTNQNTQIQEMKGIVFKTLSIIDTRYKNKDSFFGVDCLCSHVLTHAFQSFILFFPTYQFLLS